MTDLADRPWHMAGSRGHVIVLALLAAATAWGAFIEDDPTFAAIRGLLAGVLGASAVWRWIRLREAQAARKTARHDRRRPDDSFAG